MANINVVQSSYILSYKRLDADFFQKKYIDLDLKIQNSEPIIKIADTVDLQSNGAFKKIFEILNDNELKTVPYIRSGNVGNFFINKDELHFISEKAHSKLPKTHTQIDDILMARKGKIGGATLITNDDIGYNSNDNVVNIRLKSNDYLVPYFVTFWNSKFGLQQVERYATGNVQPWLSMKQVRMLRTVKLDKDLQEKISNIVLTACNLINLSKSLSTKAFQLLDFELNLDKVTIGNQMITHVSFFKMMQLKRIDAQCYKPEYVMYERWIEKNCPHSKLGNLLKSTIKGKQRDVLESGLLPYVSIKDIDNFEIIHSGYCNSFPQLAEKDDLLLAITGATIGKVGLVSRNEKLAFCGDLLNLIVDKSKISPFYLITVLKSKIGQTQFNRWISGATNGHLSPIDVKKILIPRLSQESEEFISEWIKQSLANKLESELLLEQAKTEVETLIEQAANRG